VTNIEKAIIGFAVVSVCIVLIQHKASIALIILLMLIGLLAVNGLKILLILLLLTNPIGWIILYVWHRCEN